MNYVQSNFASLFLLLLNKYVPTGRTSFSVFIIMSRTHGNDFDLKLKIHAFVSECNLIGLAFRFSKNEKLGFFVPRVGAEVFLFLPKIATNYIFIEEKIPFIFCLNI